MLVCTSLESSAAGGSPDIPEDQPQEDQPVIDFEQQEEIYPPLPESGLPEGWTMDQWKYYGEQWLERQN